MRDGRSSHAPQDGPGGPEASGCCPFQEAIDLLSRRHAMTIIWLLQQQEPRRFNEIKRELGINPVSLSQRLTELEQGGILDRTTYRETPPRVEYRLTAKGRDLLPLMDQLNEWSRKHDVQTVTA
jgi:DNA-binding HxlR family transcriptional regulator